MQNRWFSNSGLLIHISLAASLELTGYFKQEPIVENLLAAGLEKDCPYVSATKTGEAQVLTAETVEAVEDSSFSEYASRINTYLQVSHSVSWGFCSAKASSLPELQAAAKALALFQSTANVAAIAF